MLINFEEMLFLINAFFKENIRNEIDVVKAFVINKTILIPRFIFQAKWQNITEHAQKKFFFLAKYFAFLFLGRSKFFSSEIEKAKPIRMQEKYNCLHYSFK